MPPEETDTIRIFMAPGLYVQGPGAVKTVGRHAAALGSVAGLLCDDQMRETIEPLVAQGLAAEGLKIFRKGFSGKVTHVALDALAHDMNAAGVDVVIGAGGGSAVDAAKGVSTRLGVPVVTVPTVASTDAAPARGVAVYDEDNRVAGVEQMQRNPAAVIVDTAIIAAAPARFLVAGIGDAVSKHYEAQACIAAGALNKHRTRALRTGAILARSCLETIQERGAEAIAQASSGIAGEAVEDVVEAILLMGCIAFENTGLSVAHSLAPALAALGRADTLHGEHAAYGTMVQAVLEERPAAEIGRLADFFEEVGLSFRSAHFVPEGSDDAEGFAERLARLTVASPNIRNHPRTITAADIVAAIAVLDELTARRAS